jgi:two-component system cell cycle sensor histidine kinase/response regulator CckA
MTLEVVTGQQLITKEAQKFAESIVETMFKRVIKVLLVEHDENDYMLIRDLLAEIESGSFELIRSTSYEEALEAIEKCEPDVCLIDYRLGEYNCVELLRETDARGFRVPTILLTTEDEQDIDLKAMKVGAADYLIKEQIDKPLLGRTIRYTIERARTLEALRASESKYRQIVETAVEGIWTLDCEARASYVNRRMAEMLGYSVDEMLGRPLFDFMDEDERAYAEQSFERRKQGIAEQYERRLRRRDGTDLWALVATNPIHGPNGEFVGSLGMVSDITERKLTEQELRKSEERYRDLVENARDIIYSHDLEGNYTSMNKAGEQITGYMREEALGMNQAQVVAPEYFERARQMIARKLVGEDETVYELDAIAKDGHRITIEVNTRLVYQDGVPVGVQGIARDITERKQLAEQLRQSQKMEAIGKLAGGIAHDFNNLLTAISGYSDLTIRKLQPEDPLRHHVEEIKKASERAASLTRQLLAFSRKQVLQPVVLDLKAVVSDMERMLQRLIGEDIELRTVLNPELGSIKADPGQIEQVIMNLVVNARDAMPHGGKLTIETQNVYLDEDYAARHIAVRPGAYVMVAVSDTGTGMDEQTQRRIFEPFFTTKEMGKGTGLGLSTVYGIVKQSDGNIWVYSEVEQGTTFKIYLPRLDEGAQVYQQSIEVGERIYGTETILLAEDDERVRNLVRVVLEGYGYKVLLAANGSAALSSYERHEEPIHLLLTDVVMPEMSGRDLAERLAQIRPEIKTLYMSGYTDESIVHHGILDADTSFIQKPFTSDALCHKVREVLGKSKQVSV